MLVISDIHIGFARQGGTTPQSRVALRDYLLTSMKRTLCSYSGDVLILGDLFDDFEVSYQDWLAAFELLSPLGERLTLVAGNHDHSPRGDRMSSFGALAKVLSEVGGARVVNINEWLHDDENNAVYVAHHSNQDLFEKSLEEILEKAPAGCIVMLHANYDNNFAAQTDHSLNVSADLAKRFADRQCYLVFAHEHQARQALGGRVIVLGNQWPTSIADCLGNQQKHCWQLSERGLERFEVTWDWLDEEAGYTEIDWRNLPNDAKGFVRIAGTASAAEASDVINAIASFRQRSSAFVVGNAVKIDGIADAATLPQQFEAAKAFDVMSYIEKHLEPDEMVVVRQLLEKSQ